MHIRNLEAATHYRFAIDSPPPVSRYDNAIGSRSAEPQQAEREDMASPAAMPFVNAASFQRLPSESDDTGRLQRAVNMALSIQYSPLANLVGCTVYAPEGEYGISAPIFLDGSNPANAAPWNAPTPQVTLFAVAMPTTVASGDILTLTGTSAVIYGGSGTVSVTASSSDRTVLAARLIQAVNASAAMAAIVYAVVKPGDLATVNIYCATAANFAWSGTWSGSGSLQVPTQGIAQAPLLVHRPRIRIVGDGPAQTRLLANITRTDLGVTGALSLPPNAGGFANETQLEISELALIGTADINIYPARGVQLEGQDYTHGGINNQPLWIYNVTIRKITVSGFDTAIEVEYSTGTIIDAVNVTGCRTGILLFTSGSAEVSDSLISCSTYGIAVIGQNGLSSPPEHLSEGVAIKNVVTTGSQYGLVIQNQSFGTCVGSTFSGHPTACLATAQRSSQGVISGWSFVGCNFYSGSSTGTAIIADRHTKWLLFSGCSVGGGMYGIVLGLGYTAFGDQAFVVSGCRFSANGVTDIVLYGATQTLISNSIFLSRGSGPAISEAAFYSGTNVAANYVTGNIVPAGGISLNGAGLSHQQDNFFV